jgi:hypothetical protein
MPHSNLDSREIDPRLRDQLALLKSEVLNCPPEPAVDWIKRRSCDQGDQYLFFGETRDDIEQAKEICLRCFVRLNCLGLALEEDANFGVWGGLSQRELRLIKKIDPKI